MHDICPSKIPSSYISCLLIAFNHLNTSCLETYIFSSILFLFKFTRMSSFIVCHTHSIYSIYTCLTCTMRTLHSFACPLIIHFYFILLSRRSIWAHRVASSPLVRPRHLSISVRPMKFSFHVCRRFSLELNRNFWPFLRVVVVHLSQTLSMHETGSFVSWSLGTGDCTGWQFSRP